MGWKIVLVMAVIITFVVVQTVGMTIQVSNEEATLRTTIEAKQEDNMNEYDLMWKEIEQVAQVSEAQKDALHKIFTDYAAARTSQSQSDGSLMKWVQESVPNADLSAYKELVATIRTSRERFAFRQKELLDLNRQHKTMLRTFPSNVILGFLGRKEINVTIITSTRTKDTFSSGKDDNVKVFGN